METTAMLNKISVGRYVRHEGQGLFIYNIKFFKRIGDSVCFWSLHVDVPMENSTL